MRCTVVQLSPPPLISDADSEISPRGPVQISA
jgi:hypothetical protein